MVRYRTFREPLMSRLIEKVRPTHPFPSRKIALSILTWNTAEYSVDAWAGLIQEAEYLERLGHEPLLILCDNGSDDLTVQEIKEMGCSVPYRIIENTENTGNCIARNQIIQAALEEGADYLFMSDSDIEVVPLSTHAFMVHLEAQPGSVAAIGVDCRSYTGDREAMSPFYLSVAPHHLREPDFMNVAWTQYGLFRMAPFRAGIRFEERGAFGGPGWGHEDVDLYLSLHEQGYNLHCTHGLFYLHRELNSSQRLLRESGVDVTLRDRARLQLYLLKWWAKPTMRDKLLDCLFRVRHRVYREREEDATVALLLPKEEREAFTEAYRRYIEHSFSEDAEAPSTPTARIVEARPMHDYKIQTAITHDEMQFLYDTTRAQMANQPGAILEIGSWHGASTLLMADATREWGVPILAVDHHEGDKMAGRENTTLQFLSNVRFHGFAHRVIPLVTRVETLTAATALFQSGTCAMAFIDGDHTKEAVLRDFQTARHFVGDGLYVFHDYGRPGMGVTAAIEEIQETVDCEIVGLRETMIALHVGKATPPVTYAENGPIPVFAVPVLNRGDLLLRCVRSIDYPVERLVIVNNGNDSSVADAIRTLRAEWGDRLYVSDQPTNIGVSASWNHVLKTYRAPFWVFCGSDIELAPGDLQKIVQQVSKHPKACAFGNLATFYNCFALTDRAVRRAGYFDENFYPAYFEDNDYDYRLIRLLDETRIETQMCYRHGEGGEQPSATLRADERLMKANAVSFPNNREYYIKKWGGPPGEERYSRPFNHPHLTVRDWTLQREHVEANKRAWQLDQ